MELFTLPNLFTLLMLIALQAVLGFDNLLYIALESQRVEESRQAFVRRMGLAVAIALRIVLLFAVLSAIEYFKDPWFSFPESWGRACAGSFNLHSIVVIIGGVFLLYTATKEISHMLTIEHIESDESGPRRSVAGAITWIVAMNLVFSFDSILSAMALTDRFILMAAAIVVSGGVMIWLADRVAEFLKRNRKYEVLGLFILLIVGILLLSEGGHLAHLKLAGYVIEPMEKSTFYFVIAVLVLIDVVQGRYQKKLLARRQIEMGAMGPHS